MLLATKISKENCKNKIKQNALDAEKTILEELAKTLIKLENDLKTEFERYKEENLSKMKEYYHRLLLADRLKFENQIDDLKKKHDKVFKDTRFTLEKYYKEKIDSVNNKLQEKLLLTKSEFALHSSHKTRPNNEFLESRVAQKLMKLNRIDQQLRFFKDKIKTILNNYANLTIFIEESGGSSLNYVLDIKKMYQTYLGSSTDVYSDRMMDNNE